MNSFSFINAEVLFPDGLAKHPLNVDDTRVSQSQAKITFDLQGFMVLPGIVDLHGDGFERHLAPRRGAVKDLQNGLEATHNELSANGITTAVLAQFYSWEDGMRGPAFAKRFLRELDLFAPSVATTMLAQLRVETHMVDHYDTVVDLCHMHKIPYVVFNDHLPHKELEAGKKPPRLTGQALKSGRSPEDHLAYLLHLHAASAVVQRQLPDLINALGADVILGSHDDATAQQRQDWHALGVGISEFPETLEAAKEAHHEGSAVIMGAPNLIRGGSHKENISALSLIEAGLCSALASDYHYPALRLAALQLAPKMGLAAAWALISKHPAKILGLEDRGTLAIGKRADFVILEARTGALRGTFAEGIPTFLSGDLAERLMTRA